jgi:uncharacterized membrane protein
MNILKSGWLRAIKSDFLAFSSDAHQFVSWRHSMIRAGYLGALCLTFAATVVGGIETAQGAQGGKPGKPGEGGGTKATSFTGVNLGVLPGDNGSTALAVSESGSVVGESWYDAGAAGVTSSPAYWYFNGRQWDVYPLPTLGLSNESNGTAFGIAGPDATREYVVGYVGGAAVIWTILGNTSISNPEPLDPGETCTWSVAQGVNVSGDAVGICDDHAAIWRSGPSGYTTNVLENLAGDYSEARDVNDDGVVVGRDCGSPPFTCHAFVFRIGNEAVIWLDDQINRNPYSLAVAVSDVVTVNGKSVVYVTGSTVSADNMETGTRWTVPVALLDGSSSDIVTQVTLTKQTCAGVNNAGDAVCTSSGGRQSTALIRDGVVSNLKPTKRATDAAAFDLARADALPTYAVGVAQVDGLRATVWVIDQ